MSLGNCFGELYRESFDPAKRKKILNGLGLASLVLFIILRGINHYGDPVPWAQYNSNLQTMMSVLAVNKYPPSLCYLLLTLGPAFLFLGNSENMKGRLCDFFCTFGRVPFFYYMLHLYLIHLLAALAAFVTGNEWKMLVLTDWVSSNPILKGYGFDLWVVYFVWALVIALLYPLCKRCDLYKQSHKEKWWLSYL